MMERERFAELIVKPPACSGIHVPGA